ncbi:MAG: hypothetical protein K6V97_04170 [Actinomycetia bacterium]|nr:hypothetical protein [Actinomycetes bacterium]
MLDPSQIHCPICHSNRLQPYAEPHQVWLAAADVVGVFHPSVAPGTQVGKGVSVWPFRCLECGYVLLFDR